MSEREIERLFAAVDRLETDVQEIRSLIDRQRGAWALLQWLAGIGGLGGLAAFGNALLGL